MSETQDVIEVMARWIQEAMARHLTIEDGEIEGTGQASYDGARRALSALASAGYRLAGPGECVVPSQQKAPGSAALAAWKELEEMMGNDIEPDGSYYCPDNNRGLSKEALATIKASLRV